MNRQLFEKTEAKADEAEAAREAFEMQKLETARREAILEESEQVQTAQEIEYANQLAAQQEEEIEIQGQVDDIKKEGTSFGNPSIIRYFILLFVFAIPNDAVDAIELTGLLAMLAWFLSFFLSAGSVLLSWFTDAEQKRADSYMQKLEAFQANVVGATRTFFRVAKFFRKNPTVKIIAGAVAEMLPFISLFPWSTIAVIWAYADEHKIYKNARKAGEEISVQVV